MYREYIKRKEKVIISAIDILDESGIQGLTTKELAKREGITEPAIYKQYDSKLDIVLTILERFAVFDDDIINTIVEQKMSPRAGIMYFAESYASYYQSYPQITTVLFSLDVFRYEEKTNQRMAEIMKKRYEFLAALAQKAIEAHEIEKDLDPGEMGELIFGVIWSTTFKWKLDGCKTGLRDVIMRRISWMLER